MLRLQCDIINCYLLNFFNQILESVILPFYGRITDNVDFAIEQSFILLHIFIDYGENGAGESWTQSHLHPYPQGGGCSVESILKDYYGFTDFSFHIFWSYIFPMTLKLVLYWHDAEFLNIKEVICHSNSLDLSRSDFILGISSISNILLLAWIIELSPYRRQQHTPPQQFIPCK